MEEIWVDVKDYEGLYQISNCGRVKSLGNDKKRKEKILKYGNTGDGHLTVALSKNGKIKKPQIHRLVAQHFIPNPQNKPIAHHIDKNPENNNVDNIMWVTEEQHKALHPEVFEKTEIICSKPIVQYTMDGQFVAEYKSAKEAERNTEIYQQNICACCNKQRKSAGGFKWQYK